jgi:soluble lytic murein transglycosylase-like protein
MALVAAIYHLPPRVLPSIQAVEGGVNGQVRHDANSSVDLGVMQVNTVWLPALSRYTGLAPALVKARLISAPCFNIAAAGAILRTYLNEAHGDLMTAIGDYHSHTAALNDLYQSQVINAARHLFAAKNPAAVAP